jgi:hypothetical protein
MRQTALNRFALAAGITLSLCFASLAHGQGAAAVLPAPALPPPPTAYVTKAEVEQLLKATYPNKAADGGIDAIMDAASKSPQMEGAAKGRIAEMAATKAYGADEAGGFKPVKNPTASQNDLWSTKLQKGMQVKVHKNIDDYVPSMMKDNLAESFAVPDDHVDEVKQLWRNKAKKALAAGNKAEAKEAIHQMNRVVPIGKTYKWLDAKMNSLKPASTMQKVGAMGGRMSKAVVRHGARAATVFAGGAIVGSAEACIALVQYASGEISESQLNNELMRAGVQCAAGTAVSAVVLLATPAAPVVVVIAIGAGTAIAADYLIEEFLGSCAPSDEMNQALARPIAPMDIDALLGGRNSRSVLIRQPGHVPLEELLAPRQ